MKAQKKQQKKDEENRRFAELMRVAGNKFMAGENIHGHEFCDLLRFHGLWGTAHPRTKHFLSEKLSEVHKNGDHSFYGKRGSKGSSQTRIIARRLAAHLETSNAADAAKKG